MSKEKQTYNPCDDCQYSYSKNNQESSMCKICEFTYFKDRKQSEGKWEWYEEWNPSTTEHPRECDECGWRCGNCKIALADIVGGYWDDAFEIPELEFCPNCGAKMKGSAI